jgi:diguanylate cyclase (GGDEF)-like protein
MDEDELISELNQVIAKEGRESCQVILHVLTNLEMKPDEAETCWSQIIRHYESMHTRLGRRVSLRTAICDYFCSVNRSLKNPKVIEINIYEKTVKASRYDSLTGLFNRQSMDEALERELSRAKRYNKDLSVIFFDLDDFKYVNDTHGHQAGDEVLKQIAAIIMAEKRMEDIAARYGGEEIVVILPETEKNSALVLAERIRKKIDKMRIDYKGEQIRLTVSGGLASFPSNAENIKGLLKCADRALYRAKGAGKNNISFYSEDRRNFLRVEFSEAIRVKELGFEDPVSSDAKSINISIGGLLFESSQPLTRGTKVQISLPLNEKMPLLILGQVVRSETIGHDKYEIAVTISFQEMERSIKTSLTDWIKVKRHLN